MTTPETILIAAMDTNRIIGKKGALPWHIKPDLLRFRTLTRGYPVIMGRHTWDSLHYKPLSQRLNIVVSTTQPKTPKFKINFKDLDQPIFTDSLHDARGIATLYLLHQATVLKEGKIFIIGGAQIYNQTIDHAQRMLLTFVHTAVEDGDAKFPHFSFHNWRLISQTNHAGTGESGPSGADYSFLEYERI